jgi:hypothetical protein
MRSSLGEINKIIGPGHFRFTGDINYGFSFEDKQSLLEVRVDMGVGLTSVLNLTQDHLHAIRPTRSRAEEAVVGRFGMARRGIRR